jgi:hypothetical protein
MYYRASCRQPNTTTPEVLENKQKRVIDSDYHHFATLVLAWSMDGNMIKDNN